MRVSTLIGMLLLILPTAAHTQDSFYITKVKGNITTSTGIRLTAGATISAKERLSFNDSLAVAFALDNRNIDFLIAPFYPLPGVTDAAIVLASPVRKHLHGNVEAVANGGMVSDLAKYFGNDRFVLISNATRVHLDPVKYPLSDDLLVVFSFKVNRVQISKRIPFENGILKIDRNRLLETKGGLINVEYLDNVNIYLLKNSSKVSTLITSVELYMVNRDLLVGELKLVAAYLKNQSLSNEFIRKYLYHYVFDFYGKADAKEVDAVVELALN